MHETGIHKFGYVQVRVPCRDAHFYRIVKIIRQKNFLSENKM